MKLDQENMIFEDRPRNMIFKIIDAYLLEMIGPLLNNSGGQVYLLTVSQGAPPFKRKQIFCPGH